MCVLIFVLIAAEVYVCVRERVCVSAKSAGFSTFGKLLNIKTEVAAAAQTERI